MLSLDIGSKIHCEIYFAFLDSDFVELKIEIVCDIMQEVYRVPPSSIFTNMLISNIQSKVPSITNL